MPVAVSAPVSASTVVAMTTIKTVSASIITKARPEEDAEANGRNEKHGSRPWWRVIITRRGSAVRLNHICAGV